MRKALPVITEAVEALGGLTVNLSQKLPGLCPLILARPLSCQDQRRLPLLRGHLPAANHP
jgi:hypothetical protein